MQAQAQLQSAEANTNLANVTKYRETTLANQGWETKQNADNATANFSVQTAGIANAQAGIAVAVANQNAQQATVDRLQALTAFEQVKAPFDGVITARNVEAGDLLTAGHRQRHAAVQHRPRRPSCASPSRSRRAVRSAFMTASKRRVTVPEMPGRVFKAHVARNAVALQAASRSMLTEVDVPNPDGAIRPGLFVNVTFSIPRQSPAVVVPDEALVFNADGLRVATVEPDNTIRFRQGDGVPRFRHLGRIARRACRVAKRWC